MRMTGGTVVSGRGVEIGSGGALGIATVPGSRTTPDGPATAPDGGTLEERELRRGGHSERRYARHRHKARDRRQREVHDRWDLSFDSIAGIAGRG